VASIDIYLEVGTKRVFAAAVEWPGWCRSGKNEDAAIEALVEAGPRYARALGRARSGFAAPEGSADLVIAERVTGNATTDFGAPGVAPAADDRRLDTTELERQRKLLRACWAALDRGAAAADGVTLRTGPRGGGRSLDAIVAHVAEAEDAYLRKLGGRAAPDEDRRAAIEAAVTSRARGEPPARPPRSGNLWAPRYAVRRTAWHALDHAWEIEDRSADAG